MRGRQATGGWGRPAGGPRANYRVASFDQSEMLSMGGWKRGVKAKRGKAKEVRVRIGSAHRISKA